LVRVVNLGIAAGGVARIVVFGSFVTAKTDPNDVDIFLVMDDAFDVSGVAGEARLVFDHLSAQPHFGASVFWARRASCFPSEAEMVSGWGLKRDGTSRGIIELLVELP
jgi:predicted nucleotidyltransferase